MSAPTDAPTQPDADPGANPGADRDADPNTTATTEASAVHPPATPPDLFAKVKGHEREAILTAAREADVLPYFHVLNSPAMPVVEMEGSERIMLGSNNYLGLTADERVLKGAQDALHRYGTGLTGSRFLNGTIPLHLELEQEIAQWLETEDAIVFTTGHQANLGTLGTLLDPGDTVIADSGDHASILDGCLLSKAKLRPFRHSRIDKLERALQRAQGDGGGVLVVVDGVFSMEGDIAPLRSICELCGRYGARLMVDEAHGAGVLGARGAGTAELLGVEDSVDLRMGTFSKSLASCGGFVAGPHDVIEYLRLYSRPFLFTASAVPAALGAALAALRIVRSPEGVQLFEDVLANARRLRQGLHELGFAVVAPQELPSDVDRSAPGVELERVGEGRRSDGEHPDGEHPEGDPHDQNPDQDRPPVPAIVTPVVPILVGDDWRAGLLWRALYEEGVFVNTALH
ncbi:MAG TPA: aminotransferase class I/II-fold pyridoxal phosphate-dependent enzyme, partial [Solirubrobacteraceae bacterium]|nr:aminotransferase class I/II-fold pyridoxal phosphate-dependent enzyme [Solirubrobacteraceae bacterium]